MGMCCVPECRHYAQRDRCRFFRLPKDEKIREIWIRNIRRQPTKHSLVCSCHFQNGEKVNNPTIFKWSEKEIDCSDFPEKMMTKQETLPTEENNPENTLLLILPSFQLCHTELLEVRPGHPQHCPKTVGDKVIKIDKLVVTQGESSNNKAVNSKSLANDTENVVEQPTINRLEAMVQNSFVGNEQNLLDRPASQAQDEEHPFIKGEPQEESSLSSNCGNEEEIITGDLLPQTYHENLKRENTESPVFEIGEASKKMCTVSDSSISGPPICTISDRAISGQATCTISDRPIFGPPICISSARSISNLPMRSICDKPISGPPMYTISDRPVSGQATCTISDRPISGPPICITSARSISNLPMSNISDKPISEQPMCNISDGTISGQPMCITSNRPISNSSMSTITSGSTMLRPVVKPNEDTLKAAPVVPKERDMYDHFGEFVAGVLRKAGDQRAILITHDITSVLTRHLAAIDISADTLTKSDNPFTYSNFFA